MGFWSKIFKSKDRINNQPASKEYFLSELIRRESDVDEWEAINESIASYGTKATTPLLEIALDEKIHRNQRKGAIHILGMIGDTSIAEQLFDIFVKGINPSELHNEYNNAGNEEAGIRYGFFTEAKEALEKMGFQLN